MLVRGIQVPLPEAFAVREAFNSKNWKGQVAFTAAARVRQEERGAWRISQLLFWVLVLGFSVVGRRIRRGLGPSSCFLWRRFLPNAFSTWCIHVVLPVLHLLPLRLSLVPLVSVL